MLNRFIYYKFLSIVLFGFIASYSVGIEFQPISLNSYFNNDGISWDTNRNDGNFDGIGDFSPGTFNLAAEELPSSNSMYTTYGIPFIFADKADGKLNNILCKGQILSLSTGNYSAIYLLGASVNGSYEEEIKINYRDGSTGKGKLALSDWCVKPQYGELPAISASYRQMRTGDREPTENHLWLQAIYLDTTREIISIQLPESQSLHIFGVTLSSGGIINLSKIPIALKKNQDDMNYSISIQSHKSGNLYFSNETAQLKVIVKNIPEGMKRMIFHWRLKDIGNNVLLEKEEVLTRWGKDGFSYPVEVSVKKLGWYQLEVTLLDNKTQIAKGESTLGWMIPNTDITLDIHSRIGMGLGFASLSSDEIEKSGQLAELSGIKWAREEFGWVKIEPQEGKWVWNDYDNAVKSTQRFHLMALGLLDYWTGWSKPYTEDGYKQYANYVYQVVSRYKDKIKYWEIWNEPNIFYWKGTPEQYTELLKAAYQSAKKADPECKIIGCTTAGVDLNFIEKVLKSGGIAYMDGISVHPYRDAYPDQNGLSEDMQKARKLIDSYGTGKELWITELGWWTNSTDKPGGVDYNKQASSIIRSYVIAQVNQIDKIFWYTYRDSGKLDGYSEDNYGILRKDFTPKPSYLAFSNMNRMLNGYSYTSSLNFGEDCAAYLFQKENKKILIAWRKSSGALSVGFQSNAKSVEVSDMYGNTDILLPTENVVTFPLTDMPVYISGDYTEVSKVVEMMNLKIPNAVAKQGQKLEVGFKLKNIFSTDLVGNVALKISDTIQRDLVAEEQGKEVDLKPGEEKEYQFKFKLPDTATIGLTPIEANVEAKNGITFRLKTELVIEKMKILPSGKQSDDTTKNGK